MQKKGTGQNAKRGGKVAQKKVRQLVIDFLKMKKGTQKQVAELFGLGLNGVQRIWIKSLIFKIPRKHGNTKQAKNPDPR